MITFVFGIIVLIFLFFLLKYYKKADDKSKKREFLSEAKEQIDDLNIYDEGLDLEKIIQTKSAKLKKKADKIRNSKGE